MGIHEEGIIVITIGIFGILGNLVAIPYFGRRIPRQQTFYMLLTCLSICDLIVVINGLLLYGLPKVSEYYAIKTYMPIAPFAFPTFEIGCTGGIYFTMAISIERYFVVCRPFWYLAKSVSSNVYTIPIFCFAVIYNIPKFFEITTVKELVTLTNISSINLTQSNRSYSILEESENKESENNTANATWEYVFEPTELRKNTAYYGVYHIGCEMVFQFIVPLVLLFIANFSILMELVKNISTPMECPIGDETNQVVSMHYSTQQRNQNKQVDRAKVTLLICGIFIFCHLFKWVLNIYELHIRCNNYGLSEEGIEEIINESEWFGTVVNISNTLVVLNSSINFYVYVLKDVCTR